MSLIDDIRQRKDYGPGLAEPLGDALSYTDPGTSVAERTPEVTWFVVSDESIDRDGDVVRSGDWDTQAFIAGGASWLWDHGEQDSRPIGKAIDPHTGEPLIRVEYGRTLAGICWDTGPWGQEIKGLVDRDMVRGASIGFLPKSGRQRQKPAGMGDKKKPAWDISSLEILEFTVTPTNSNRNALKLAIDRGELSPMVLKSFKKALGTLADTAGGVLAGKEDEKHVDEHAEFKAVLEDCVGRKVKVLMDEGKDQKQALAIAYSMCGEEHSKALNGDGTTQDVPDDRMEKDKAKRPCPNCGGKAKGVTMSDMDETPAVNTDGAVAPPEEETPDETPAPVEPHGVTVSRNCLEHIKALLDYLSEHGMPGMEPDSAMSDHFQQELIPVLQEVATALHETASAQYPDADIGEAPVVPEAEDVGEDEPVEDADDEAEDAETVKSEDEADEADDEETKAEEPKSGDESDMDEEEEKSLADKYARTARGRALLKHYRRKGYRMSKAAREVAMKACGTMSKAADHMDETADSGELAEEKSYMHKGHAAALRKSAADVSRVHGGDGEDSADTDMPKNGDGGGDMPEEAEKSLEGIVRKAVRMAVAKEIGKA